MSKTIQITLPKEILEKAKERDVDMEKFKDTVKTFALLDIIARTSRLSKKDSDIISKRIKASAWKKIKRNLNL